MSTLCWKLFRKSVAISLPLILLLCSAPLDAPNSERSLHSEDRISQGVILPSLAPVDHYSTDHLECASLFVIPFHEAGPQQSHLSQIGADIVLSLSEFRTNSQIPPFPKNLSRKKPNTLHNQSVLLLL